MADLDVIEPIPRLDPIVAIGKDELVEGGLEGAANRPVIALANQIAFVMQRTYAKADVDEIFSNIQEAINAAEKGLIFYEKESELLSAVLGTENRAAQARDTSKIYLWKVKSAAGVTPVVWGWVDTGASDYEKAKNLIDYVLGDFSTKFKPLNKNIFNPKSLILDKAISSEGLLVDQVGAVSTGLIDISERSLDYLSISGLEMSAASYRGIRFLDADKVLISNTSIGPNLTFKSVSIPFNAKYVQFVLKNSNNAFVAVPELVQVELSEVPTEFVAYEKGELLEIYGARVDDKRIEAVFSPKFSPANKNIFDPENIIYHWNLNNAGALVSRNKTITTGLVDVSKWVGLNLSISGLTSSAYTKYGRFLDEKMQLIAVVALDKALTSKTIAIPMVSKYFQITLRDATDTFQLNTKLIQFEISDEPTALINYERGPAIEILGASITDPSELVLKSEFKKTLETEVKLKFGYGSKNIFNPVNIVLGKAVSGTGEITDSVGAIMTDKIDVSAWVGKKLSVSGFSGDGVGGYKAIRFINSNSQVVGVSSISPGLQYKVFDIPAGSKYLEMTLKVSNNTATNVSAIQFEISDEPTAFEPYKDGELIEIYGTELGGGGKTRAHGASYLLFGDSITETSKVDDGVFNSTTYRVNWPVFAKDLLNMSVFRNYAKSGASFKNRNIEHYQFLGNQIAKAIENNENPDVIVIACGTNDGLTNLGTYEAAMAKSTLSELDQTICLEAARHAFWTLRATYPDAVCFYCNPLQRMSATPEELELLYSGLGKMAKRYGFIVIDQNKESGIIRELEVLSGSGKYLSDGLHPNAAGSKRQADLIVSKIISNMSY